MVNMNAISVASVGAIQELSGIIDTEKDRIAVLETDLDREKLKTTNLQERILVMEQAYYALLERVSNLENN